MPTASLFRHADFRRLWAGDTASQFATFTGHTVLPLLAATVLFASPAQMGLLAAAEHAAFLLLGLPAGVWVDRMRRRPLMIRAGLVRALLLLSVPLAGWFGVLTLTQLMLVAALVGVSTLFFDIAYQSFLPSLIGRARLLDGNAKLQASQSVAQVGGPGIGGGLAQLAGAANAVLLTGCGYLVSVFALWRIRSVEPRPSRDVDTTLRAEVAEGLRFVFGNPSLRAIVCATATANLSGGAFTALEVLFLTRDLSLPAGEVGLLLALGGIGGVTGALTARAWTARLGQARAIWLVPLCTWPSALLVPLAAPGWRVLLVAAGLAGIAYGGVVYNVAQVTYRQAICPDRLLGRMNASVRFVVWGVLPIGGLAGGWLAEAIGVHGAIWACTAVMALGPFWVICSPLRRVRDLPSDPDAGRP
ncbi:MFS transporter [Amycolatopsis antarctica]|uniref:MFS transporter n=1 Tax=Amycolatopsis antarctica TaxID=1854586 RepID=A0A263D7N1_9PSEU|nr:MFS transporter [Amycolatopsis antarctica]OZM74480.1 MFS transporter [Amycolatopsis antarctica]